MTTVQFLSHVTRIGDPGWPGNPTLAIKAFSQIASGDVANTYHLELFNHFGTHMDSPNHFNASGIPLVQLPPESFIFRRPYLLDQPLGDNTLLTLAHLQGHPLEEVDCLLIRSGFESVRTTDPKRYAENGPGIGSDAAQYLMDHCRELRMVVIDWISISAYQQQADGYLAHQILAGAKGHGRYVLGVEDSTLKDLRETPSWVIAMPLRIEGTDGGPCTVIAGL